MNYDISTIENCYKTMEEMTGFQYWEDIFKIYTYRYIDEPDRMRQEQMSDKNIDIRNIEVENINFVLQHVTTSAEKCKDIREQGLHDLVWSCRNNTELKRFLDEKNIRIDIENKKMQINDVEYDIPDDIKVSGGVGYKLFNDPFVCGCFQLNKYSPYGGQVHLRPEIIFNIGKLYKGESLEHIWMKSHTPFIVKFKVPYMNMMVALSNSLEDKENMLQTMFDFAFNTVFYNHFSSDNLGILKRGIYVPPEDIISIEEY